MNARALSDIRRKLQVLHYAKEVKNVSKACRYFGISRQIFYQWKRAYEQQGKKALINSKPFPQNLKLRIAQPIEDLILH